MADGEGLGHRLSPRSEGWATIDLPPAGRSRRYGRLLRSLVFPWAQIVNAEGSDPVLLDDRLFAGPAEVMDLCRHLENAAGGKNLPFLGIQALAEPHVKGPRDHRHGHLDRMPVGRDLVVGGKLQAHDERTGSV